MNDNRAESLFTTTGKLRRVVAPELSVQDTRWVDTVPAVLSDLASALQHEAQHAGACVDADAVDRALENTPVMDRFAETARGRLIRLADQVHQLRTELHQSQAHLPLNLIQLRLRCLEVASAVEAMHQADDRFLFASFGRD